MYFFTPYSDKGSSLSEGTQGIRVHTWVERRTQSDHQTTSDRTITPWLDMEQQGFRGGGKTVAGIEGNSNNKEGQNQELLHRTHAHISERHKRWVKFLTFLSPIPKVLFI